MHLFTNQRLIVYLGKQFLKFARTYFCCRFIDEKSVTLIKQLWQRDDVLILRLTESMSSHFEISAAHNETTK